MNFKGTTSFHAFATVGLAAWLILASGCYLRHGGPAWDRQARRIAVPMAKSHISASELNRSIEPNLTRHLRLLAAKGAMGGMDLVTRGHSDVSLHVTVLESAQTILRSDRFNVPLERQVHVRVHFKLERSDGTILSQGIADSRMTPQTGTYDISQGDNIEMGIKSATRSCAQAIVDTITGEMGIKN